MTRQELRARLKARRASLGTEEQERLSAGALGAILSSPLYAEADLLLLYAPIGSEADLTALLPAALAAGKTVAFPRCAAEGNRMDFYAVDRLEALTPGAFGVPEPPAEAPIVTPDARTLCILPGLGFDPFGNRIGYGKGYYDAYLSRFPSMVTLGVCHSSLLLRRIPARAHDRAVSHLVTERGLRAVSHPIEEAKTPAKPDKKATPPLSGLSARLKARKKSQPHADSHSASPLQLPPILIICVLLLLLAARALSSALLTRENESLGLILLQVPVFLLPAIVWCRLRGISLAGRLRLRPPRPEQLFLFLALLVMMISGGLLTSILTGGIRSLGGEFTLYDTFTAHLSNPSGALAAVLAYALLPAFCEEVVFRSVLCAEYEGRGVAVAIGVSSLAFAMLHCSLPHFLTYLLLGALLSCGMYATRSVWTAILLHLCYNLFCLFGQPYLSAFYVNAGSNEIFLFCLGVLFLLSSALAAGEARKLYHLYAKANLDSSYTKPLPLKETPQAFWSAVATPLWLLPLGIFLIASMLSLYA